MKLSLSLKQAWIALILFATIVPAVTVMAWYIYNRYDDHLNEALSIERQYNESLRDQISSEVKRLKTLLKNKSDSLAILIDRDGSAETLSDINILLGNIIERERAIHEVMIISSQAEVIAVVDPGVGITPDLLLSSDSLQSMLPHFDFDKKIEAPEIVIPLHGRNYIGSPKKHVNYISFTVAVPIGDPAKAVLIALVDVEKLWFSDKLKMNRASSENARSYMLDRRGGLLNTVDGSDYKPGDAMTHMSITRAALINEEWPLNTSYTGVTEKSVYGTLTTIPSLNWTLVTEITASKTIGPILQDIYEILLLALACIIIFVLFVLYLAQKTLIPIENTCDAIDRLAKGDYQFDMKRSGIRELDAMVNEFNNMVGKVLNREQAINNIAQGVTAESGNVLFQNLVNNLANYFDTKYAFIGLMDVDEPQIVNTLAVSTGGKTVENLSYDIKGTPCEKVINNGACIYPEHVQELFPEDVMLQEMGVISYFGAQIVDGDGVVIGLMVIMNTRPFVDIDHLLSTLEIFSTRAGIELERLRVETALRESEARFRQLAESINQVFWLGSPDWKRVFYISPAYEEIWGLSIEDLYENPEAWFEAIHPEDKEQVAADIPEGFNGTDGQINFREYRILRPDGELRWIKARAYPIYKDNTVIRVAGIAEDVTEFKLQREQIQLSEKMNAMGKLTGGIAHDYNNMLGIILGYSEMLKSVLKEQPKSLEYANKIHHAGERGAKLTSKLLAFSSKKSTDAEALNINALLLDEQHMLEKTLTARIQLSFDLADDLWTLWLDAGDLEGAIVNLSINAMHAIDGSGQLSLRTNNLKLDAASARRLDLEAGDYVQLSITDTGCGMDKAVQDRIFEPFFSTKGENGTGLGLTQVYGFVERSKGVIDVYSKKGHGTIFEIYFPRYIECVEDVLPAEDLSGIKIKGDETILIVDDEQALLEMTAEVLRQEHYNVICAKNGKQALDILAEEPVDMLLSDVVMPRMDGYQLAAKVQEKYHRVKIQLMSGYTDNHSFEADVKKLHENILHKPCRSEVLLRRVRTLLDS